MMLYKGARVEYVPLGVLAAIVSWNYPFHNMYGQIISAIFSGNAIVIKVSEHVCWLVLLSTQCGTQERAGHLKSMWTS